MNSDTSTESLQDKADASNGPEHQKSVQAADFEAVVLAAAQVADEAVVVAQQVESGDASAPLTEDASPAVKSISRRSGAVYMGVVADGRANGKGVQKWPNGHTYEGEWHQDTMTGFGRLTQADSSGYTGRWQGSLQEGVGCLVASDDSSYLGEWKQGKMHGEGEYTWPDGAVYVGQFQDGEKSGNGRLRWQSGMTFDGEWLRDKEHGSGVVITLDGRRRRGEWAEGERLRWVNDSVVLRGPPDMSIAGPAPGKSFVAKTFEALEIEDPAQAQRPNEAGRCANCVIL